MRLVPPASVVGAHAGQYTKLFANTTAEGPDSSRRFRPRLMLELAEEHLACAGDRLDDAFAFLDELGYAAFELAPGEQLVPVKTRHDGDFWFIAREDPTA